MKQNWHIVVCFDKCSFYWDSRLWKRTSLETLLALWKCSFWALLTNLLVISIFRPHCQVSIGEKKCIFKKSSLSLHRVIAKTIENQLIPFMMPYLYHRNILDYFSADFLGNFLFVSKTTSKKKHTSNCQLCSGEKKCIIRIWLHLTYVPVPQNDDALTDSATSYYYMDMHRLDGKFRRKRHIVTIVGHWAKKNASRRNSEAVFLRFLAVPIREF